MQLPLKVDAHQKATLQSQIVEQIRLMILDGRLRSGDFLPTTRALSEQVGISRNTTMQAYERLMAEGYIQTRPYVGTFVSAEIPENAFCANVCTCEADAAEIRTAFSGPPLSPRLDALRAHGIVNPNADRLVADFWVGRPAPEAFPLKEWSNLVRRRLTRSGRALAEYRDPAGFIDLRQAIADHLGPTRGLTTDPDQIVIVGGTQDGLNLIARLLLESETPVVLESPCYQGAAYLFESFGADLLPVPVDACGIDIAQLPDVERGLIYVTPSHQYPLGVTMTLERRLALLNWVNERNSYIIEDDYDSDFRFVGSPVTALKGLDRRDRVFYLGTFSKCMGPSLRLGFVVLPSAFVKPAKSLKALMNNGQPWLEQAAMADFMMSGAYARHLRRLRQMYLSRRNVALAALERHFGPVEVVGTESGMHFVWRLPDGFPAAGDIELRALDVGVGVYTLSTGAAHHFGGRAASDRHLVLGYAALSETEIDLGIARLAQCLGRSNGSVPRAPRNLISGAVR